MNDINESMLGEVYFTIGRCIIWCKSSLDVDFYFSVGSYYLEDTLEMILKENFVFFRCLS